MIKKSIVCIAISTLFLIFIGLLFVPHAEKHSDAKIIENINISYTNQETTTDICALNIQSDSSKNSELISEWISLYKNNSKESCKFNLIKKNYESIIGFVEQTAKNTNNNDNLCLGIDGSSVKNIRMSIVSQEGIIIEIPEDIKQSLFLIKTSFDSMGYVLDTIRIKGDVIIFDSIDGRYSLIYSPSEEYTEAIESSYIDKVDNGWYHKKRAISP